MTADGAPALELEGIWKDFGSVRALQDVTFDVRPGEIHGAKNWRHPRLKRALSSNERDKARLEVLFGMTDETFRDDAEDLHYAMARYVCQWLDERGKLWPFYQ